MPDVRQTLLQVYDLKQRLTQVWHLSFAFANFAFAKYTFPPLPSGAGCNDEFLRNKMMMMMMMMVVVVVMDLQVAYVFCDCSKFTSVFTLCALSVDRFLATFHQLSRYRQIRVGLGVCTSIWIACLVVSSPYWIYGSTTVRRQRAHAATGSDVIAQTGNATTTHGIDTTYNDTMLGRLEHPDFDLKIDLDNFENDYDLANAFEYDADQGNDLGGDLDPESCHDDLCHC